MKVNKRKLQIAMANRCMASNELQEKSGLPRGSFLNVVTGRNVRPATAGKVAKALNVNVTEIFEI